MQGIALPPTVVVIPTYNEIANLSRLVPEVLAISPSIRLLVVDDASSDGTGMEADRLVASSGRMDVIHRPGKLGLGSAYKQAFQTVLCTTGAEFICQMDADFSHRPVDLRSELEAACLGVADIVVGSRWIPGGTVSNWPFRRFLLSRVGNLYARMILGVPQCDLTGGLKCWRRKVLESIDLDAVVAEHYAFQIEMSWRGWKHGFSIYEVPITFVERAQGVSKMSGRVVGEALVLPWKLRLQQRAETLHKV
jgi:dolichol-phosphate mannosyltransferase